MIIDTHCHYNVEPLLSNANKHWQNSLDNGVVGALCIGTDNENSKIALDLSKKFDGMFASIAIHPEEYTDYIKTLTTQSLTPKNMEQSEVSIGQKINQDISEFERLLIDAQDQENNKLIAIGEIGLDYYRLKSKGLKRELAITMQKQIFSKQLVLAFKNQLPVILHVRDQADRYKLSDKIATNAYYDTFEVVNKTIQKFKKENLKTSAIILHCASGPIDYIKNFLDIGAYIGFGGNVTYKNAPELREIFKITPEDKILLETDAPYLAPGEKKGELCQPHLITKTAEFLQNNYQLDLDIIITNTIKVFPQFKEIINNTKS